MARHGMACEGRTSRGQARGAPGGSQFPDLANQQIGRETGEAGLRAWLTRLGKAAYGWTPPNEEVSKLLAG